MHSPWMAGIVEAIGPMKRFFAYTSWKERFALQCFNDRNIFVFALKGYSS